MGTVPELLERAARHADRCDASAPGLRFLDRAERARFASWRAIHDDARRTAGGLQAAGVRRGDRVALVFPTGTEFFSALFGALLAGAVPTPLYPPVRLGRLAEYQRRTAAMLRAAGAVIVLSDARVRRLLGEAVADAGPRLGCRTLAELPVAGLEPVSVRDDELALVQFSSGTTVSPKPVALSHAALMSQTRALNAYWPESAAVRHAGVSWLPLYHDMGLIGCVLPALERPAELTLLGPEQFVARPASWLRAISRYRATISPAPSFAYGLCVAKVRDAELDGVDLSSWRVALNGAEAISPAALRAFAERFARWGLRAEALTPVYGLSEAALAVTFSPPERPPRIERFAREPLVRDGAARPLRDGDPNATIEMVSVGVPVAGFRVRVVRDDGAECTPGRVGRIEARGPSLMAGYLGRPDATAAVLRDGWLDTGDVGFVHDGELFVVGRAKDLVVVRGRNYAPEEIERAVDDVPGVRTGCAVATSWLPDAGDAEELVLFVERRRAATADAVTLAAACRERLLRRCELAPAQVVVVAPGTLPRTSSGKLRRGETLRRFRTGTLAPPAATNVVRLLATMARSHLALRRARRREPGDGR